jgi:ABC-2 type transport system ATP-binding protein
MALIELEKVEVHYGDLKALDGVSCAIEGGTVGLLGPNGAGKSTLLKTLLGYNRASSGAVRVFGKPMPKEALSVRQGVGYMPEREVISPKVSAVSFLTYCGRLFGMSWVDAMERTHEVLNYVGIGESRYRKMETYSTGMLQRVKLAQALVHDPQLLLLDEPTNGLDPDGRIEMLKLVQDIAATRKVTILLSSHLLPDVQQVCDQVIMIGQGKVLRTGTIVELTTAQDHQYEVRVRDHTDAFEEMVVAAGLTCTDLQNGNLLIGGLEAADGEVLFRMARECGTHLRHFATARTSLAEVFMQTVGKE